MRITVGDGRPSGFLPPAYVYLAEIEMRKPASKPTRPALGIYNVSVGRLQEALEEAADAHQDLNRHGSALANDKTLRLMDPILRSWDSLLAAAAAHTDDIRQLAGRAIGGENPWKAALGRRFDSLTASYDDWVGRVANHIKHSHGRLRPVLFYTSTSAFPGYFVEGVNEHGAVGPEPTIHRHGYEALSFARDFRLHLVWMYLLSEALADVLRGLGAEPSRNSTDPKRFIDLLEIGNAAKGPFFPGEERLPVPKVEFQLGDEARVCEIGYVDDGSARSIRRGKGLRITARWHGDGATDSFRPSYGIRES